MATHDLLFSYRFRTAVEMENEQEISRINLAQAV
jgi:hypothetical protein